MKNFLFFLLLGVFINAQVYKQEPVKTNYQYSLEDTRGYGVYTADDFILTEATKITELEFYGLANNPQFSDGIYGAEIWIFEDGILEPSGKPKVDNTGLVFHHEFIRSGNSAFRVGNLSGSEYTFNMSLKLELQTTDVILQPNKRYWIVFTPKIYTSTSLLESRWWKWFSATQVGYTARMFDKDNNLGYGGAINGWMYTISSLAFSIIGETNLGTSEVYNNGVFIYQNDDFLNIENKTNDKVLKTTIIDFTGKEILSSKEMKINIASLQKGVYFAKIEREGKRDIVYKFIKN